MLCSELPHWFSKVYNVDTHTEATEEVRNVKLSMAIQHIKSLLYAKALLRTSRPYAHLTWQPSSADLSTDKAALTMLRASHRGTGKAQANYRKVPKAIPKEELTIRHDL